MTTPEVVLDDTTVRAMYEPDSPAHQALTQFYVEASFGHGRIVVPSLCLVVADTDSKGAAAHAMSRRFLTIVPLDAEAVARGLRLAEDGYGWSASQAIHAARPTGEQPEGRVVLTLTPEVYADAGVIALRPDA
ncbi:hypothetical protein [Streptomyces sp. NPDC056160]|uniref:hypothetical protein n=1 Tax=Streptomyces sp. NPDC056160 TaxID=3345731 RepID=UPI0035DE674C